MKTQPRFIQLAVLLAPTLLPAATSASEAEITDPELSSSHRTTRPFTISFALSGLVPAMGLDLSYQLLDRVGVGVQATSMMLAHTDVSLRTRAFVVARPSWGLYAGLNGRLWHSPILFEGLRPLADAEIGYEWRGAGGFTLGLGAGAGFLLGCCDPGPYPADSPWTPIVMTNFRAGTSF